jgi:hypothetical protein
MMDSDKSYQREKDRRYAEMYWHAPKAEHLQQLRDDSRPPNDPVQFVESVVRLIERRKEEDNNDTPFHIVVPRCYKELMDAKYPMPGLDLTVKDRLMKMNGTVSVRVGRDVNHVWLCSARKLSERNSTTEQEPMFVLSQSDKEKFKELWRKHIDACTAENIYNTSKDREQKYFLGAGRAFTAEEIQQLKDYEQTLETELKKLYEEKDNRKRGIDTASSKDKTVITSSGNPSLPKFHEAKLTEEYMKDLKDYRERALAEFTRVASEITRPQVNINFNGIVVGPEDRLVLTLHPDVHPDNANIDDIKQGLRDIGIDLSRVLMLWGFDASVIKPQADVCALPFPGQYWGTVVVAKDKVNDWGQWGKNLTEAEKVMRPLTEYDDSRPVVKVEKNGGPTNAVVVPKKEWEGKFIGDFNPVAIEDMEEVARQSIGKPFLDSNGQVLGTVEKAWVENGEILQSVAWDKLPTPEAAHKAIQGQCRQGRRVEEQVERVTLGRDLDSIINENRDSEKSLQVLPDGSCRAVPVVSSESVSHPCGYCNGTGRGPIVQSRDIKTDKCPVCGGKGSR